MHLRNIRFLKSQATSSTHATGTAIGTTNGSTNMAATGSFAASTPISCTINGADLSAAVSGVNAAYIIKVFVKMLPDYGVFNMGPPKKFSQPLPKIKYRTRQATIV